jgi:hypothetical protein
MKMKLVLLCLFIGSVASPVFAKKESGGSHSVKGYVKKSGTYVAPHKQTNPNRTQRDNWSSKPNSNPYTGKAGTKEPQK